MMERLFGAKKNTTDTKADPQNTDDRAKMLGRLTPPVKTDAEKLADTLELSRMNSEADERTKPAREAEEKRTAALVERKKILMEKIRERDIVIAANREGDGGQGNTATSQKLSELSEFIDREKAALEDEGIVF